MVDMTDADWKAKLSPEQYHVLREKGTEAPGTGKLLYNARDGMYACAACGQELFKSDTKFESTMPGLVGWPAFAEVAKNERRSIEISRVLRMLRVDP